MHCKKRGLPVPPYLPEFAQVNVYWISDTIQPSHPLPSSSPFASDLSQNKGFFQWLCSTHLMAKVFGVSASASVLPRNIHGWFPLGLTSLISLLSNRLLRVISSTTIWKHQFSGTQSSLWSNSHIRIYNWKNYSFDYMSLVSKVTSLLLKTLSLP